MKDKINPLTNAGECSDVTNKKDVEKMDRIKFFKSICRKVFKRGNEFLWKHFNIKMLRIDFWDMETDNKKVMKVGKYE